jgi:hypothetical protein
MNTESDTPTPRTDAYERHYIETGNVSKLINLARELERELADAKKHCDPYEREAAKAAINVLKRDLVESKKNECDTCDAYTLANMQLREDLANLAKQRDALAEALRNLANEIGRHESASMMHPRLTRAIAAATKLTTETRNP